MHRREMATNPERQDGFPALGELERELSVLVRRALRRLWTEDGGRGALDRWTYAFLVRLSASPMRVGEVARSFGIDKSTASRHMKRIVEGGLAEALVDADDARSSIVRITALGKAQLADARVARMEPLRRIFATWPEEERRTLARLLGKLNAELDGLAEAEEPGAITAD
ncbi:MarR family transcriptional regulator [Polyangium sp. 6x1]|uniref:MarR family winged helix-turn-helix transcriptional regulator n=1 Tax=Polyangium sp. 6x1 TaxID=3042689 RepID=UPI00248241D5|nr:MarR family transcriptional regulator [Polyangium sp. 6x1]MDI1449807.1 MarR family transcriptional regulator [Polyangium sp. 6x1]